MLTTLQFTNFRRTDFADVTTVSALDQHGRRWVTVGDTEQALVIYPLGDHVEIDQFADMDHLPSTDASQFYVAAMRWISE